MVDKGFVIIFVLNYCFSIIVYCDDNIIIRFFSYDAKINSKYSLNYEKSSENNIDFITCRNVFMLFN